MDKKIPTGVCDFRIVAGGEYHFVDKSLLIKDIIEIGNGAFLFTRPRRFGKTMNLSMLEAFFGDDVPDGTELFSGLKISAFPKAMEHLGKYKVIRLNFADIESSDMDEFKECFSLMMSTACLSFDCIGGCEAISKTERDQFVAIRDRKADRAIMRKSLSLLVKWVRIAYGKETVILIDEYDKPVHQAYLMGFYNEFMKFYAPFMESSIKSNQDFRYAILTGVSHVSKETIFSGLNNLMEFDVFEAMQDESFGFTESEVSDLIAEIGLPSEQLDVMRAYYDGYRFGTEDVYNPFSVTKHIMSCLRGDGNPKCYWVQSADVSMIADILTRTDPAFRDRILTLAIPGNAMERSIDPRLTLRDFQSTDENLLEKATLTLMVTSGYLKAVRNNSGRYTITVPNMEVSEAFEDLVQTMNIVANTSVSRLSEFMFRKDAVKSTEELNRIMDGQAPRDHYDETVHKFFLSLLFAFSGYRYQTELGSGDGYVDLYIKGERSRPGLLIELKYSDEKCDMSKLADSALKQISEKEYSRNIGEAHIIVGIGCHMHSARVAFGDTVAAQPSA